MKKITIRNLGPLKEATIDVGRVNIIIGPQSTGKSCVLKTTSYCTWVEKQIELEQSTDRFAKEDSFIKELETYHKLKGYIKRGTYIEYESDYMTFSYDNVKQEFTHSWKEEGRWTYKRPQVSYIPSERNLVAAIPNWLEVKLEDNNIRGFMSDWENARKDYQEGIDILNLDIKYRYREQSREDKIFIKGDETPLSFTGASSGLQALVPLYVYIDYICKKRLPTTTVIRDNQMQKLAVELYTHMMREKIMKGEVDVKDVKSSLEHGYWGKVRNFRLSFFDEDDYNAFMNIFNGYTETQHCEIFLEEPENCLFPPTQQQLAEWLLRKAEEGEGNIIFMATHSPYILSAYIEKEIDDFRLFFIKDEPDGQSTVVTAAEEDVQEIFDYGVDAFFNIEAYTHRRHDGAQE